MKKLITTNLGGFPFVLNDIRWMDNGISEAINSLITPYLPYSDVSGVLKISGLDITVDLGSATVAPGYVYINDEIYYCAGLSSHSVVSGNVYRLKVQTSYDPNGSKLFQSGVTHDAYAVRVAELTYEASVPASPDKFQLPDMSILKAIGKSIEKTSRREQGELTLLNSWEKGTFGGVTYRVVNGICYIDGTIICHSTNISEQTKPICEIPSELLPYFVLNETYGDTEDGINKIGWQLAARGFVFTSIRFLIGANAGPSYTAVATEVNVDFSSPSPRSGLLRTLTPGTWPVGTTTVIIKICTSWPIKPI